MFNSLWVAKTGMEAQDFRVQTIANNMANASTNGFKKDLAHFSSLAYSTIRGGNGAAENGEQTDAIVQVGRGVEVGNTSKIFTQGAIKDTASETDFFIGGEGFFTLEGNPGEAPVYTRDGHFEMKEDDEQPGVYNLIHVSSRRKLMGQSEGYTSTGAPSTNLPVVIELHDKVGTFGSGPEVFSSGMNTIRLDSNGRIWEESDGGGDAGADSDRGYVTLARFGAKSGLTPGSGNVFRDSPEKSGGPLYSDVADLHGYGSLDQYKLEVSNVTVIDEMVDMIEAQRGYEMGSKVLEKTDEMMSTLIQRT